MITIPKKKYYIIDFSSVKEEGFTGIEEISDNDNVIIFFVKGESSVDFSILSKLYSCGANVIMKEIARKNLIPLVISMYIGSISNENPDICLVSSNGEDLIKSSEIVLGNELNISVQNTISGIEILPTTPAQKIPAEIELEFDTAVKKFNRSESDRKKLLNIYNRVLSVDSDQRNKFLSDLLVQKFGYDKAKPYYHALKTLIEK
ncbi:MAG: hypothetical protein K2J39_01245 [Ruminococcus sp.]|nr:hypothetical protein [Ruminococcus sp.]